MLIHIKTMGIPPSIIPAHTDPIQVEKGATLRDVLMFLIQEHPSVTESYFKNCTFLVNRKQSELEKSLEDGDRVLILRTLGGG